MAGCPFLLLFFALVILPIHAMHLGEQESNITIVAKDGIDTNACGTSVAPCASISFAVEQACQSYSSQNTSISIISVQPGAYNATECAQATCPIQIISTEGSSNTTISLTGESLSCFLYQTANNITLSGFTFQNGKVSSSLIEIQGNRMASISIGDVQLHEIFVSNFVTAVNASSLYIDLISSSNSTFLHGLFTIAEIDVIEITNVAHTNDFLPLHSSAEGFSSLVLQNYTVDINSKIEGLFDISTFQNGSTALLDGIFVPNTIFSNNAGTFVIYSVVTSFLLQNSSITGAGIFQGGGDTVQFSQCDFSASGSDGFSLNSNTSELVVENTIFHDFSCASLFVILPSFPAISFTDVFFERGTANLLLNFNTANDEMSMQAISFVRCSFENLELIELLATILSESASLTIMDSIFTDVSSTATDGLFKPFGGRENSQKPSVLLSGCSFISCSVVQIIYAPQIHLTIIDSNFTGTKHHDGPLFFLKTSFLTITNTTFENNRGAGLVMLGFGVLQVSGTSFLSNRQSEAIFYLSGVELNLYAITIEDNSSSSASDERAVGVMAMNNCQGTISHVRANGFFSNWGGFAYSLRSNITITDSYIAAGQAIFGGSVYHNAGFLTIQRCIFDGSTAYIGGAIYTANQNELLLEDCIFRSCSSDNQAGAIFLGGVTKTTANNVTITDSDAEGGGSIAIAQRATATFTNTFITRSTATHYGGGVSVSQSGKATFIGSHFSHCIANSAGSAFEVSSSGQLTLENSLVENNYSPNEGAGIYATDNGEVTITNSTFSSNIAQTSGGAITLAVNSTLTSNNSLFVNNLSESKGGSIAAMSESQLILGNTQFMNNSALSGGAIYCTDRVNVYLSSCIIQNCTAVSRGGAIYASSISSLQVDFCTLAHNTVLDGPGGAIAFADKANGTLTSSSIIGNTASAGAGIYGFTSGFLSGANCSFLSNLASSDGGGISSGISVSMSWVNSSFISNIGSGIGGGLHLQDECISSFLSCHFEGNSAAQGGAIYNTDNTFVGMEDSRFENNNSTAGGAIFSDVDSNIQLVTSSFLSNKAVRGGALFIQGSIQMDSSQFENNGAQAGGALFYIYASHTLPIASNITNCNFTENGAITGGAIALYEAVQKVNYAVYEVQYSPTEVLYTIAEVPQPLLFTNITMERNKAVSGGALFIDSPSEYTPQFQFPNFKNNNASSYGGAILFGKYPYSPLAIMGQATFDNNTALFGGCNVAFVEIANTTSADAFCYQCEYSTSFPESTYQTENGFASEPTHLSFGDTNNPCGTTFTLSEASNIQMDVLLYDEFNTVVHGAYLESFPISISLAQPSSSPATFITNNHTKYMNSSTGAATFQTELCGPNNSTAAMIFTTPFHSFITIQNITCDALLYGCESNYEVQKSADCATANCTNCDSICVAVAPGDDQTLLGNSVWFLLLISLFLCCILICILAAFFFHHYRERRDRLRLEAIVIPDLASRPALTLDEIMNDPSIPRLPWKNIEIHEVIGKGASGLVSRGTWHKSSSNEEELALKEMILGIQDFGIEVLEEFLREIKYMSALKNKHIVCFLGISMSPNLEKLFLVTELMHHGSIRDVLDKGGDTVTEELKLRIVIGAAKGVAYLHKKNLIHRDLKTQNLLVNKQWECKVADFGISRVKPENTRMMTCIGTPIYMAPEVLSKNKYSEKADVYSFGIVLCEVFTGEEPYSDPINIHLGQAQLVQQIVGSNLRPLCNGIAPALKQLIVDCWNAEPNLRPTFPEIVIRLNRLCTSVLTNNTNTGLAEMNRGSRVSTADYSLNLNGTASSSDIN